MPPATFMQLDERRDHSIRVPRPDRSVELGTPNACTGCHTKQSATWARDALASWYPLLRERPQFGDALAKERKGTLDAPAALRALVADAGTPAIARATALERLGQFPAEKTLAALRTALASTDALVVYGAALGAAELPLAQRAALLVPALDHRVRAVRIVAARALAGVRATDLPPNARAGLERGFAEVEASLTVSASQPESQVELSAFELARGRFTESEAALEQALRLRPCLAEAQLNLAELRRQRGDESGAERSIRAALECSPENAAAHHALGLWQVRAHQASAALASLKKAAMLAPNDARYQYVFAVALAGNGERGAAIRVLEAALEHRPNDANALQALAGYLREAGQMERAAETRQKLEALLRD
jgi:Tfp pilus assembly protein PilF